MEGKYVHNKIGVILLAAGSSSRLGRPKQLLVLNGKTLLQHSLEAAGASAASPVILVLGANADRIKNEIKVERLCVVVNRNWEEGMASSIRAGVAALKKSDPLCEGCILMVCDQPYINASLLKALVEAHYATGKLIVTSGYANTFGPPTLFHKTIFPALLGLNGDVGARSVLQKYSGEVEVIPFPAGQLDIDTKADLQKLPGTNL